jgi:MFS family permease
MLSPRGFNSIQAGIAGGIMILGGVVGALVIPTLSDKYRRRTPFIVLAVVGAILGMVGITYASGYALLLVSSFVLGFFLLAAGPVGFQYAAEITYPAPEGTSNGMLILMGQISGILFIVAMDSLKDPNTGSMTGSMLVLIGLLIVCLLLTTSLKESKAMLDEQAGGKK